MTIVTKAYVAYLDELMVAGQQINKALLNGALDLIAVTFRTGRRILIAGNGGSAATASHMMCDLAKTTLGKGKSLSTKRLKAIALTDNVPAITAWGNDVSYDVIFAEQLRNLAEPGDLLIVISASGNSPNILAALEAARDLGVNTLGLLGFDGGRAKEMCDWSVVVPSPTHNYGIVEDAHCTVMHWLTEQLKQIVQGA